MTSRDMHAPAYRCAVRYLSLCISRAFAFGLLSCILATSAMAGNATHAEIDALLKKLSDSSCRFQRNGAWYSATQASDHLSRKMKYADRWRRILSAEEFVALIGSRSSDTGRAYSVSCPGGADVDASVWLLSKLAQLRLSR